MEAFARIKAATKGAVEIRSFPQSQLGSGPAMLGQLRSGALEMLSTPGAFVNIAPVAQIENLAYAFPNRETALRAMDGELGQVIRAEFVSKGLVPFENIWENGFREITTSLKPIKHVNDLAGLKIRVSPGQIRIDTFKSLGASPTPIAVGELYTALQSHVVDAQENPLLNIETLKMYEVQKYCSLSHHIWSAYWTFINADVWQSLPQNYQTIITKEMGTAALRARRDNALFNESLADKLRRRGLIFNEVDIASFKARLIEQKYYERWRKEFGEKAWTALERYANKLS